MSLSQFVSKKFGKLEASSIAGGAQTGAIAKGTKSTVASNGTISATQLLSGSIIRTGVTSGTEYFPSAADLIAQINILTNTQASVGMCFDATYLLDTAVTTGVVLGAGTDSTIGGVASATGGALKLVKCVLASLSGTAGSYLIRATNL